MSAALDLYYLDIDGVVANDLHRQHFITNPPGRKRTSYATVNGKTRSTGTYTSYASDYDAYFGDAALDTVWDEGRALYERLQLLTDQGAVVGFLTGRRIDMRAVTNRWLLTKGFDPKMLVMKPFGLVGKLAEFKLDTIKADLAVGWGSVTIYDDDPRVIKAVNDYAMESGAACEAILCDWHVKPVKMQFAGKA